jgi:aspartate 1-decarboxylase
MQIQVLKSKIHRVKVTGANLNYIGSITIDESLLEASNIIEGEKVAIVNINNGERFETYAIPAKRGSKTICLNGATAHKGDVGDRLIIFTFAQVDEDEADALKPLVLVFDENNEIITGC